MCSTLHFSSKKRMCQHHFLYFILKNIKSFSYSQLSNYTKNSTALGHGDGACYKITLRDFVVNCTLPVNTSACLSQRRVSTGVFTNRAMSREQKSQHVIYNKSNHQRQVTVEFLLFITPIQMLRYKAGNRFLSLRSDPHVYHVQ